MLGATAGEERDHLDDVLRGRDLAQRQGGGDRVDLTACRELGRYPARRDDVCQPELWAKTRDAVKAVDVLVNDAGTWIPSPLLGNDESWKEGWDANLSLNSWAAADPGRSAVNHFRERGGGIISVTSRSTRREDDPEHLAYGAAKGGLAVLTEGIAGGFAGDGAGPCASERSACTRWTRSPSSSASASACVLADR